jgi:formate dehydrogenase (NADP+) alpha subunit
METVSISIDGRQLSVAPGTTILAAALAHGIDIPHLCAHPDLHPSGGCRLCLVEVDGRPTPQPSCSQRCEAGMVVRSESAALAELRHDLLDLFVSDHPLRCVACDKNGACELQRYCYRYGLAETSYGVEVSRSQVQDDNPFFVVDAQYCILCGKCARVCDEVVGVNAIDYVGRGFSSRIATPFDIPLADSSCVFCGSCVQVCPTAALLPKSRLGKGREWELGRTRTICGYCGVGCGIEYATQHGAIRYAQGYAGAPANGEFLCVKGRFGWDFVSSAERLTEPLIRRDLAYALGLSDEPWSPPLAAPQKHKARDQYLAVDWTTALDVVAQKLAGVVAAHGPDALAGLASARCTNEENYLFQKLVRASLGTNNVDHCARLCHASSVTGLGMAFGSGAMTNPIRDIRDADCILITGSNTAESHPVIGYEVVRAVKQGASLIVIDPRRVPLVDHATLFLQPKPGTDGALFLAMAHVILREGWADHAFIAERTEGFDAFAASVAGVTPEVAALVSGVPAELIEQAARLYARGERAHGVSRFADAGGRGHATILYAMGITQRRNGTDLVLSLANLALLCGQIGKPSTGVNPLRGQSNVQGACDVGALPNVLPGYQPVADATARAALAGAWGLPALPATPGLTVVELIHAAAAGSIRAMYIMGENPMLSDPNIAHVEEGLRALEFLVVQDIFLSETAQLAHVVLPAAASLEKDGSFTNTERRVQLLAPVLVPPGEALPDWRILCELGARLDAQLGRGAGDAWRYPSTAAIMDEIAAVTPIYRGIGHQRLGGDGLCWPCPDQGHPGTPLLHAQRFTRGLGKFHPVTAQLPAEQPDADYPLILTTGRILYHYHTGTMTRRSEGLEWREPRAYAEISAEDAAVLGLRDAGPVLIHSRRGTVRAQARVSQRVAAGVVFLAFHWREAAANALTQDFALDPLAKIPEYKACAVRLELPAAGRPAAGR